jgi:hypothetical protein
MNLEHRLDESNAITYRLTPWDTRAFEFKTSELLSVQYTNEEKLSEMLSAFDSFNRAQDVRFCYTRISSKDHFLKHYLQKNGFYYAETSVEVAKNNIMSFVPDKRVPVLTLEVPGESDYEEIKQMASEAFDHSRFHEDVNIDPKLARVRFYNWVEDLIRQEKEIYVARVKGEIVGFNIQDVKGDVAHIILTGCKKSKSMLSVPLWQAVIMDLQSRNIKTFETLISASNTGVFNLYIYFQFKVMNTLAGMHKFYY